VHAAVPSGPPGSPGRAAARQALGAIVAIPARGRSACSPGGQALGQRLAGQRPARERLARLALARLALARLALRRLGIMRCLAETGRGLILRCWIRSVAPVGRGVPAPRQRWGRRRLRETISHA